MTVTELCRMSATELAEAIRSGQVSSREVAEAQLRQMGHDPGYALYSLGRHTHSCGFR